MATGVIKKKWSKTSKYWSLYLIGVLLRGKIQRKISCLFFLPRNRITFTLCSDIFVLSQTNLMNMSAWEYGKGSSNPYFWNDQRLALALCFFSRSDNREMARHDFIYIPSPDELETKTGRYTFALGARANPNIHGGEWIILIAVAFLPTAARI